MKSSQSLSSRLKIPMIAVCGLLTVGTTASFARPYHHGGVRFEVNLAPPVLRTERVIVRPGPGYVWVPGFWEWRPVVHNYVWVDGRWSRPPRARAVWVAPRWERHGRHRYFVSGYWR